MKPKLPVCRPTAHEGPPGRKQHLSFAGMLNDSTVHRSVISAARLAWLIGTVLAIIAVALMMVVGIITPRTFGFLCLASMCASGVIYYRLLKNGLANFSHTGASPKLGQAGVLVALILGSFGAHHFYLGRNGWGILYLLFCWTGIPTLLGFIECFFMPARVRRFNAEHPQVFAATGATAIGRGANGPIETAWKDLKSSKSICGAVPIGT